MGLFCRQLVKTDLRKCCSKKHIVRDGGQPKISYMRFFHVPPLPRHEYKTVRYDANILNSIIKANTLSKSILNMEEFKELEDTIRTIYAILKEKKEEMNTLETLATAYAQNSIELTPQNGICLDDGSVVFLCDYSEKMQLNINLTFPYGGILS